MRWNYLFFSKLQRLHCWSLGMDKKFHLTLYNGCNYLSMLGLKLNHISKRGPWRLLLAHYLAIPPQGLCNAFEDWTLVEEIYVIPIFEWVAVFCLKIQGAWIIVPVTTIRATCLMKISLLPSFTALWILAINRISMLDKHLPATFGAV